MDTLGPAGVGAATPNEPSPIPTLAGDTDLDVSATKRFGPSFSGILLDPHPTPLAVSRPLSSSSSLPSPPPPPPTTTSLSPPPIAIAAASPAPTINAVRRRHWRAPTIGNLDEGSRPIMGGSGTRPRVVVVERHHHHHYYHSDTTAAPDMDVANSHPLEVTGPVSEGGFVMGGPAAGSRSSMDRATTLPSHAVTLYGAGTGGIPPPLPIGAGAWGNPVPQISFTESTVQNTFTWVCGCLICCPVTFFLIILILALVGVLEWSDIFQDPW